jgi:hypothetical protein
MLQHRAQLHAVPLPVLITIAAIAPFLAAIGVAAVAIGRRLARSEQEFLVEFLKRTLDARSV